MQVGIDMGTLTGGEPAKLDIEELLATRLLVQGNSGSGKSHLLRRLLEQSAPWVQQCIIDPEGDFVTLADKFGHVVVDGERTEAELAGIAARIRQHRVSCVLTLEGLEIDQQMRAAGAFLNGMFDADREFWYPVLVVVDEAQMFAPAVAGEVADDARKISLGAMTNLMCRGRKRGLAGVIATQRLAKLAKNVAAEASNFLMGRTFLDIDMARAADLLGMDRRQAEMFRDLKRGSFVALGPALSRRPLAVSIGPVETSARSSSPKLMPLPEAPQDVEDLIFTPDPEEFSRPLAARRPPPTPRPTTDILSELARATPAVTPPVQEARPSQPELTPEEREEKLAAVLEEILADPEAAFRSDAVLYQEFLVRARMRRVAGPPMPLPEFRRRLAVIRSGVDEATEASDAWSQAVALSGQVTEDLQGVFLLLARHALTGGECPPDAEIARAYGTHSARRARRFLSYFEEQGLIVVHTDFSGKRIVAFPDLGVQTAPGDAVAA
jgi:DNA helicase HerA-like ATPase